MSYNYVQLIKSLRERKGVSQEEIADKLGISRQSYMAVEHGKRDLSLSEAEKLADFFGISLEELAEGVSPHFEKYKQMILAYLRACTDIDGKIPKTKLAKLLYLADFSWFYTHLESMSGMQYRRIHYGPVPDMYFRALDELEDAGIISIERKKDGVNLVSETKAGEREVLHDLNSNEKKHIEAISHKWKGKRTQEIVAFTHKQLPYKLCEPNEIIPYELITQEDPEYVY